jgi:hypothetical protein
MGGQPRTEADQRRLRKRRLGVIHAPQHQLPAPIHHCRLDHLVVGGAGVGLQDRRQPKLRRRHRRLPNRLVGIHRGQLGLEALVEQLMTMLTQPDEQLGALDPLDNLQLRREHATGGCHTPGRTTPPPNDRAGRPRPAEGGNLPDPDTRPAP